MNSSATVELLAEATISAAIFCPSDDFPFGYAKSPCQNGRSLALFYGITMS